MKKRICCFTGHRNILKEDYNKIYELTKTTIENLILNKEVTYFKVGGARGFDSICSLCVLELREQYPHIKLILILPCKNHYKKWNESDKNLFYKILENADEISYISDEYTNNCMLERNDKLLEHSDYCICYLKEKSVRGGTVYTVNHAIKKEIPLINIFNFIKS